MKANHFCRGTRLLGVQPELVLWEVSQKERRPKNFILLRNIHVDRISEKSGTYVKSFKEIVVFCDQNIKHLLWFIEFLRRGNSDRAGKGDLEFRRQRKAGVTLGADHAMMTTGDMECISLAQIV